MTISKSLEYDLHYLQAGLENLEKYLLSKEMFWPLEINPPEGAPDYPRLTLDGLLLARRRLTARSKASVMTAQVEEVISEMDILRSKHRVMWEKKSDQCHRVRLRMWGDFIGEYQENPGDNADRYSYEVRLRVMLRLLRDEIGPDRASDLQLLNNLDSYVQSVLVKGSFIWDPDIQAGFPQPEYWYLYGELPPMVVIRD